MRNRLIEVFAGAAVDPAAATPGWAEILDGGEGPRAGFRSAAVLVPLVDRPEGMTVLLTQRTPHLTAHAGQIAFPGGSREEGDPTPEVTALRETEEEIGLRREDVLLLGRMPAHETGTGFHVVPVVGLVEPPFVLRPDPTEVDAVFEVPLEFVLDPLNHKLESRLHEGLARQFYVLPYQDYYIWGFTARTLVNLSKLLIDRN